MTETQKPKTRACQARVEYLAVQTEVEEKLDRLPHHFIHVWTTPETPR